MELHPEQMFASDYETLCKYIDFQKAKHLKPGTISRRRRTVEMFADWLHPQHLFDETVTSETVDRFLVSRGISAKSHQAWISHLNSFYTWSLEEGFGWINPVHRAARRKLPRYLPRPTLVDDWALAYDNARAPVMACFVSLMGFGGLRAIGISKLEFADVDMNAKLLHVTSKGDHTRNVPMHQAVHDSLSLHIRTNPHRTDGPVFVHPFSNEPLTPSFISKRVSEYLRSLNIGSTPHQLRHRAATDVLASAGGNLRVVQDFMGHAHIGTTALYAGVDSPQLRSAVEGVPYPATSQPEDSGER